MLSPGSTQHIHVITDYDPIRIQYQSANVSDQEFREFLERQKGNFEVGARRKAMGMDNRGITICDSAPKVTLTATQRKMQAEWLEQHWREIGATSPVTFLVVSGALQRGVMTAVLWLVKSPVEIRTASSLEQAAEMAVERADREQIGVPAALRSDPRGAVRRSLDQTLYSLQRKLA
jgi:hypothetical protein